MRYLFVVFFFLANLGFADAAEKKGSFIIDKMTCALCPITVREAMSAVDGVKSVVINFEGKSASVVFDDTKTNPAMISEASANAGYPAVLAELQP